jgi:UDP-2,3-diacylglucosamine hydrolase
VTEALFVSDIHIASAQDPKFDLFLRFLDHCRETQPKHLFLVGDIFDLWISNRQYFIDTYADIIAKIRNLTSSGTTVHYFEGNHDLDLEVFWQKQLGVRVYSGPKYFMLSGRKVRVEHGDQMDPEDRGYRFLRWLLRTSALKAAGRGLPNALVRRIGERASRASRDYTSNIKVSNDDQAKAKILRHAREVHSVEPFDVLVTGHVHVVEDSEVEFETARVRLLNLGTWLKEPMCFEITGAGGMHLKTITEMLKSELP